MVIHANLNHVDAPRRELTSTLNFMAQHRPPPAWAHVNVILEDHVNVSLLISVDVNADGQPTFEISLGLFNAPRWSFASVDQTDRLVLVHNWVKTVVRGV